MKNVGIIAISMAGLTAPAMAQEQAADSSESTDAIIVTAQKREQDLQDVSASISAFGGEDLRDAGISNIEDLQTVVPNITIGDSFGFANLFIRGLGLNSTFANVDPSVTVYEDGAIISQPAAQLFSFFDLERIEVLRGPQGSLYGRNATGGTINLITASPSFEFGGFAQVRGGSHGTYESEAAFNMPLGETVAARFSAFATGNNGYGRNSVTGNRIGTTSKWAARGQLLFEPTPDIEFTLAAEYGSENDSANALLFKRETFPGVLTDSDPANDRLGAIGIGGFNTTDPRGYASDFDPVNERETWAVTGHASWQVSDALHLTNIASYREFNSRQIQDADLSAVVNSTVQEFAFESRHFSEEFQIGLELDRLSAVAGFYYFSEELSHLNAIGRTPTGDAFNPTATGGGRRVYLTGEGQTDTWALFWNAVYELTDTLSIKAGGRFTRDRREIDNEGYVFVGAPPGTQLYFPGPDGVRVFKDYTNEAGLEWRPNSDIMLYYAYSEGFKAGTGQLGTTVGAIVDPETITNHEIGLKSTLLDGTLTFNAAAFMYAIDDLQLDQTLPAGPTGFITQFKNANRQESHGIEIDAVWRPSRVFRAQLSGAYQVTEFGSFLSVNPANPAQVPEDIEGNWARNTPRWSGSAMLEYDIPLENGGAFTLRGDGSYRSKLYFTEFNEDFMSQGSYALFNAQIRYTFPNEDLRVSFWVDNLTNELVEGANFAVATSRVTGRTLLAPRTFGVSASYTF